MRISTAFCFIICLSPFLYGDTASDRLKLSGTWHPERAEGKRAETWVIEKRPETIHIVHTLDDGKKFDIDCNSIAKECKVKDEDGKNAKVSMWFYDSKLVEMETRGSEVVKRRFVVTGDGDTMQLEVIPVVPDGKPILSSFKRDQASLARQ
jgi:hypothetical protein